MSAISDYIIGPVSAIYVGDFAGVTALTQIPCTLTQGGRFLFEIPEQFEQQEQNSVQSGPFQLTYELTFFPCPEAERMANGNPIGAANIHTPSGFAKYSILFLAADEDAAESVYVPVCYAKKRYAKGRQKTDTTSVPLIFTWQGRNRFATPLPYYEDTAANLVSVMGLRSPF